MCVIFIQDHVNNEKVVPIYMKVEYQYSTLTYLSSIESKRKNELLQKINKLLSAIYSNIVKNLKISYVLYFAIKNYDNKYCIICCMLHAYLQDSRYLINMLINFS